MRRYTQPVSVRFDPEVLEHLKKMARRESYSRDCKVTWTDLVRESIMEAFPMPWRKPDEGLDAALVEELQ